jgi:adenine phosphoribosyltransferase
MSSPVGEKIDWTRWVHDVPDYPQPGVLFRDLTPLWADGEAWRRAADALARHAVPAGSPRPQFVLGVEARGFLVAQALADRWGAGVLLARKPGKLPRAIYRQDYELEYGEAGLEIHEDPVPTGAPIVIADDVLATGGTALAALRLAENLGGEVLGFAFLVEIASLAGRKMIEDTPIASLIVYHEEGRPDLLE